MKGMEETLEGIRGEISKLEKEEETLAKENVEVKHELEKYETVIKENTQKMKYWKKEVGNHWIDTVLSSLVNRACCSRGRYWDYYPDALSLC